MFEQHKGIEPLHVPARMDTLMSTYSPGLYVGRGSVLKEVGFQRVFSAYSLSLDNQLVKFKGGMA
jgi:hypothetical protein